MSTTMTFPAIVKRTVILVNRKTGAKEKFTIAIGPPYRPARTAGMSDHAACLLQIYEEIDDNGTEIVGADEFEALDNAIQQAKIVLSGLVASGNVETPEGKPFTMESASKFTQALIKVHERLGRKFGVND